MTTGPHQPPADDSPDTPATGTPLRGASAEPTGETTREPAAGAPAHVDAAQPLRGASAEPTGETTHEPAAGAPAHVDAAQPLRWASAEPTGQAPRKPAAGAPARAGVAQPTAEAPHKPAAGGSAVDGDAGLLAPVRVGVPVEAVVSDVAWLQAMLDAEAALARSQARLGTVPDWAAAAITAAARADRFDLRGLSLAARETANPVVGLVQQLARVVAEVSPAAAEYVHRGSTSQDVFDTGAMLVARRAVELIRADLGRAAVALAALAEEHRDTVMPGRTLALQAVPTTFGLKAAGWRRLLLDAERRLAAVLDGGLPVSLGGAAGTLAGYLEFARLDAPDEGGDPGGYVDRLVDAFAAETGLARPVLPWHSLRTPVADLSAALAFTAGALGKVAVDVQSLTRTEVGEVAEPTAAGRGASSAMPHKRNPVLATMIRAAALQVPALSAALTACMVHEDERSAGVWHAEWLLLRECLRLVGGASFTAVELAEGLTVRPVRMLANLELTGGQMVSERVAAVLAPSLGKAEAKRLLGEASEEAEFNGIPLAVVLAGRGLVPAALAAELCDPSAYTGAAGALVDRALKS
ncbi:lyase family protein [Kitasatospora sp. NPDC048365]|uniref:lyase family protein n=1 Tax=Kitasatospora sp. NPDC048365 TaxID=3364050 RepID=UPI0037181186